jgi:hypothetical protein
MRTYAGACARMLTYAEGMLTYADAPRLVTAMREAAHKSSDSALSREEVHSMFQGAASSGSLPSYSAAPSSVPHSSSSSSSSIPQHNTSVGSGATRRSLSGVQVRSRVLTYAHVCSRCCCAYVSIPAASHATRRSLSGVQVCSRVLTYAHVCSRMLTYADVC